MRVPRPPARTKVSTESRQRPLIGTTFTLPPARRKTFGLSSLDHRGRDDKPGLARRTLRAKGRDTKSARRSTFGQGLRLIQPYDGGCNENMGLRPRIRAKAEPLHDADARLPRFERWRRRGSCAARQPRKLCDIDCWR